MIPKSGYRFSEKIMLRFKEGNGVAERSGDILVINPNSNTAVTAGMDQALAALRFAGGPAIRCATLAEGPFGIESQRDVEAVALPLRRMVEADNAADAFVIACYSDPGL